MITRNEFWDMANSARTKEEYLVDQRMQLLQVAPLETLQRVFLQYRFFTIYYIGDLALLVYKVPFSRLRSVLGEILNDELGNGDSTRAHPYIYDNFLRSIGVRDSALEGTANMPNIVLLEELRQRMLASSTAYTVGLRGMGGECLCQVQLEAMHSNFLKNPYVAANKDKIDMAFWDIHAGEEDIHHREMMREALDDMMTRSPEAVEEMAAGYWRAKRNFDAFWDNVFASASGPQLKVVTTDEEMTLFNLAKGLCEDSPYSAQHKLGYTDAVNFFALHIGTPEQWFLRAFCDGEDKAITTRLSPARAADFAPGYQIEPAPEVFGKSRVRFRSIDELPKLQRLITAAFEDEVRRVNAQHLPA